MKTIWRHKHARLLCELRIYRNILLAMMAGGAMVLFLEVCWAAKYNFFLVKKSEAREKERIEEMYSRFQVCPIDEFEGQEDEVLKKLDAE